MIIVISWSGCKKETNQPTLPDPNVSYLLDSIVTLDIAHGTYEWFREYTFSYDEGKLRQIRYQNEPSGGYTIYQFEEEVVVKASGKTYSSVYYEYDYEYHKDTIMVFITTDDATYLMAQYIKPGDKITEMYWYRENGSRIQYSKYSYINGNVEQTLTYFEGNPNPLNSGHGPYDNHVNPLSFYLIPGKKPTYSSHNELLGNSRASYDEQGRITEIIHDQTGNHTKYYYK
jgi:hypothetical protein